MSVKNIPISERPDLSFIKPEEFRHAAQEAYEQIIQALNSAKEAQQSIIQTCAESIGVSREQDISRLIWHGIVQYANADLTDEKGRAEAFSAFYAFSTLCLVRPRDPLKVTSIRELSFDDLSTQTRVSNLASSDNFFDECCHRLFTLHKQFQVMLTWLADPNGCSLEPRNEAIEFLVKHGGEGTIEVDLLGNDDFDDSGNRGAPFFFWKTVLGYRTILSPVTKFILARIEQYQADDIGIGLTEAIPIMICKRPACRRFAVLRRRTKDFCSASCRTLYRQETKAEEHAAYQRKYREQYKKPAKKSITTDVHRWTGKHRS